MVRLERSVEQLERAALHVLMDWLKKGVGDYRLMSPNDIELLQETLHVGDVILVEGKRRLSRLIMNVTNSTWSHAAMYVGNGRVVEAEEEGVILSPLEKYRHFNVRICRPVGLSRNRIQRAVDMVMESLGKEYDIRGLTILLQWHLKGRGNGDDLFRTDCGREYCSGLIARAYAKAGLPVIEGYEPEQITPRDFDLSPNFEIIKVRRVPRRHLIPAFFRIHGKASPMPVEGEEGNKRALVHLADPAWWQGLLESIGSIKRGM